LTSLHASAAVANVGSQKVLDRTGFAPPGETVLLAGQPGLRYTLPLANLAPNR